MNEISALPSSVTEWLSGREELSDMIFMTEFPPVKKAVPLKKVTVAVGLGKIEIGDTFAANDTENTLENNEYCRQAEIRLRFSVHAPYSGGGEACHAAFADIIDCLVFDSGLEITSSGCGGVTQDREADAFVLEAYADINTSLCPAQISDLEFPSFLDKTLLCGSHISNSAIHLSPEQQEYLGSPLVTGVYFGNGNASRTVSLGFRPSAVFVFTGGYPAWTQGENVIESRFAAAAGSAGIHGIEITANGFTVSGGSGSVFRGTQPHLNDAGMTFTYLAFR